MRRSFLENRLLISRLLVALGCILIAISAFNFQSRKPLALPSLDLLQSYQDNVVGRSLLEFRHKRAQLPLERAFGFLIVGSVSLLAGLALDRRPDSLTEPAATPLSSPRTNWILVGVGVIMLWMVAEANGQWIGIHRLDNLGHHVQFGLLTMGMVGVVIGMGAVPSRSPRPLGEGAGGEGKNRLEWWLLIAIILLGFGLRVWNLDKTIRILVDEIHYTDSARYFFLTDDVKILTPMTGISPFPWIYSYWVAGTSEVAGHNLIGSRLAAAIIGTLNIPALYVLARSLADRKMGLIAALLLATFPPHLHFSRLNMLHVCDALFGTLTFAFMVRGFKYQRRLDYALAGAALGLTQYFYEGGRLLFPAVMVLWLGSGFIFWHKKPAWRGLLITAMTAIIVAMPIYYTIEGLGTPASGRLDTVGLGADYWRRVFASKPGDAIFQEQLDRTEHPFLHYISLPDSAIFYGGNTPLLLMYVAPFFFLGLLYTLWHWRKPTFWLLFFWLLLPPLGTSLLVESSITVRFVVIFPVMVLTAALGIRYVIPRLLDEHEYRRIVWSIMGTLVVGMCAAQVIYYFNYHLDVFNQQFRRTKPYADVEDALLRSVDFPAGTHLYVVAEPLFDENYARDFRNYFNPAIEVDTLLYEDFTAEFLQSLPHHQNYAFFFALNDDLRPTLLRQYFLAELPSYSPYTADIPNNRELVLYFVRGNE